MLKKFPFMKIIVFFLIVLFFQSDLLVHAELSRAVTEFIAIKKEYLKGNYELVIKSIEELLGSTGNEHSEIRGKMFLLLGACYEKKGIKDEAVENYLLGDLLLDKPEIEGIDLLSLKVFNNTLLGKVINGTRVFEKVGKRKKKKKFPYLAILGVAALVATVFLLMKKKSGKVEISGYEKAAGELFNSIEWVDIPAGEFLMGDTGNIGDSDERPAHKVYLDSYKIMKYEMTLEQFEIFTEVFLDWRIYYSGTAPDHPVSSVYFGDAHKLSIWLSEFTGKTIKLPSEAQWEKAARGTDQRIYPWGDNKPDCGITNMLGCVGNTMPVGSYTGDVSFYGVMDMGGNVSEYVYDIYDENYYSISPYSNPTGPEDNGSSIRVLRGGSCITDELRSTDRHTRSTSARRAYTGFRLVWLD